MTQYEIDLALNGARPLLQAGIMFFLSLPAVFLFIWGIGNVRTEKTLPGKLQSLGLSLIGLGFCLFCWFGAWYQLLPKGGAR